MNMHIDHITVAKTYPQNWSAYNAAQTSEKAQFLKLLHALCSGVEDQEKQARGRPRIPLNDAIFAICYKIFSTVSARRFISDLQDAQDKGYIGKTPHFNSIFNYLESPKLTPILHAMITESSLPLQAVEQDFAADSSGFTASRYSRWYDHKYGVKQQHTWVKVHLMCGVKTNIVTAVEIHDKDASDTKLLPYLVERTSHNFKISEVSADKAYGSVTNHEVIFSKGATAYIPFKSNHSGKGGKSGSKKSALWTKMYHYFHYKNDEFQAHYHKRSNVESTFSMIKAKFGGNVRSKTETAMTNECLCKIICHNICVLIQESHELGIDISFFKN